MDHINQNYFPENTLKPILGNGKIFRPKLMFVFINPTHANISSDPNWPGPRFPFIGTKPIWRVFHKAGMLEDTLMETIDHSKFWSLEFTNKLLNFLNQKSFYFTNLVKWMGHDATLPNIDKIRLFLPNLEREIEIVQPEYIVTFGLIPFESITKEKIKLKEYYSTVMKNQKLSFFELIYDSLKMKIVPCYFPVGRGDPKKAIDLPKIGR